MNKRERRGELAKAAVAAWCVVVVENMPTKYQIDVLTPHHWEEAAIAAVSRAYEIDGVMELVEAAEKMSKFGSGYVGYAEMRTMSAAAARVREAMGGQT